MSSDAILTTCEAILCTYYVFLLLTFSSFLFVHLFFFTRPCRVLDPRPSLVHRAFIFLLFKLKHLLILEIIIPRLSALVASSINIK